MASLSCIGVLFKIGFGSLFTLSRRVLTCPDWTKFIVPDINCIAVVIGLIYRKCAESGREKRRQIEQIISCKVHFFLRSFSFPSTTLCGHLSSPDRCFWREKNCVISDFLTPKKWARKCFRLSQAIKVLEKVFILRPGIFSQGEFRGSDFFHQFQNKFPPHLHFPQCNAL